METIRVKYSELFDADGDRIKPKLTVRVDGQDFSPGTAIVAEHVCINGVSLADMLDRDLEVTQERFGGTVEIHGLFT